MTISLEASTVTTCCNYLPAETCQDSAAFAYFNNFNSNFYSHYSLYILLERSGFEVSNDYNILCFIQVQHLAQSQSSVNGSLFLDMSFDNQ